MQVCEGVGLEDQTLPDGIEGSQADEDGGSEGGGGGLAAGPAIDHVFRHTGD